MSNLEVGPGGDTKTPFREAYAAAETAAAVEAGLVDEDRPRDERGRFVAEAPEVPVVEEPVVEAVVETPDERDARITALEARLAEKDEFIGRQSSEVGELRQRLDSFDERLNTPQPQRQSITQDMIEQNPGAAAQLAYEQGDQYTLSAAYANWELEAPAQAATWLSEKKLEAVRKEYDEKLAAMEQRFTPINARNQEQELQQGVQALPAEVRTFLSDAPTVQALADEFPTTGRQVVTGTPQERVEAIKVLYNIHRGRVSDTLQLSVQEAARTTAEEAQAIRDEAYVASATTPPEQVKSWEQQEQDKATASFTRSRDLWNGALVIPAKK